MPISAIHVIHNHVLKHLSVSWRTEQGGCLCRVAALTAFLSAGLQLQEGIYCSSGSSAHHSQRVLEDDLGEERTDFGHADTL